MFLPPTDRFNRCNTLLFWPVKKPKSFQSSTQAVSVVIPQSGRSIRPLFEQITRNSSAFAFVGEFSFKVGSILSLMDSLFDFFFFFRRIHRSLQKPFVLPGVCCTAGARAHFKSVYRFARRFMALTEIQLAGRATVCTTCLVCPCVCGRPSILLCHSNFP